jgi:5-(aminomethyl)-3-furanmethanol phosphate kinase
VIVAKVGGSLYDDPRLGDGLRAWLAEQAAPVMVVPGGGPFAGAVRGIDRVHGLGEDAAHWLAIRSLSVAGQFLELLMGRPQSRFPIRVVDCHDFFRRNDVTPHTWDVTSDSLAAAVAARTAARKLVLLKSVDIPPIPWGIAAANGWVDPHFPTAVTDDRFGPTAGSVA